MVNYFEEEKNHQFSNPTVTNLQAPLSMESFGRKQSLRRRNPGSKERDADSSTISDLFV